MQPRPPELPKPPDAPLHRQAPLRTAYRMPPALWPDHLREPPPFELPPLRVGGRQRVSSSSEDAHPSTEAADKDRLRSGWLERHHGAEDAEAKGW